MKINKRQLFLLLLLVLPIGYFIFSQEVFTKNNQKFIFLGSVKNDSLKIINNGKISWINKSNINQVDQLSAKDFLSKIFAEKLQLQLEGYEPFWDARIDKKYFYFTDPEKGIEKKYDIVFSYHSNKVDRGVSFSFSNAKQKVFGTINYISLEAGNNRRICEYNVSEEKSLYEAYVTVNGTLYKGCSVIIDR